MYLFASAKIDKKNHYQMVLYKITEHFLTLLCQIQLFCIFIQKYN